MLLAPLLTLRYERWYNIVNMEEDFIEPAEAYKHGWRPGNY